MDSFLAKEYPVIDQKVITEAYQILVDFNLDNLIMAVPSVMTRIDKEFMMRKMDKPVNSVTPQDIKLMTSLYPEAVKFITAYQYLVDYDGLYYHAHAEVYEDYTLSEYTIGEKPTSNIFDLMTHARLHLF